MLQIVLVILVTSLSTGQVTRHETGQYFTTPNGCAIAAMMQNAQVGTERGYTVKYKCERAQA